MVELLQTREARLVLALAIGLLIGTERERRREERGAGFAGLRTFALSALLGGLLAYLGSSALVLVGALAVAAFAVAGYVTSRDETDRGVTTEVALVVTYVLGVLALQSPVLAPAIAVVMTWILALRGELHELVREKLSERELRDLLLFLLIALVVMPIAPDEAYGPYGAVNPQSLARLVVSLMAITSVGYIAQRLLNPRLGLAVTGLAAGFVSSSATIAALGMRAREQPLQWRGATAGALASCVATVAQYAVVIAAVDATLLVHVLPSLVSAALVALLGAGAFAWRSLRDGGAEAPPGRPLHLRVALGFAAVFVLVSVASAALAERMGGAGIVLVSGVAALVDAHSTAGSVASLYRAQSIAPDTARLAILTALSTNTLTKVVLAWSGRSVRYASWVTLGVLAIAAAAWAGALVTSP